MRNLAEFSDFAEPCEQLERRLHDWLVRTRDDPELNARVSLLHLQSAGRHVALGSLQARRG
jgi:hypothetical protein